MKHYLQHEIFFKNHRIFCRVSDIGSDTFSTSAASSWIARELRIQTLRSFSLRVKRFYKALTSQDLESSHCLLSVLFSFPKEGFSGCPVQGLF